MPAFLNAFHVVLQAEDDENTRAVLTLSSSDSDTPNTLVVLYDLNLLRALSGSFENWESCVEQLHERQREIFEQSITERTRELFQ